MPLKNGMEAALRERGLNQKKSSVTFGRSPFMLLWAVAFFFILSSLCLLSPPVVMAEEAVVNSRIEVDVTGQTASDARSQAMAKAEIDALTDLLNKLAPSGTTADIIATLDARKISNMIKNIEVIDEKATGNRYHAQIMISFDGNALSELINNIGTKAANEKSDIVGSFLIIPPYSQDGNKVILWEDDNPWRSVWRNVGLEVVSGDVIVPYGDGADSATIDSKNFDAVNYASLVPMTIRYGVSDIVVLNAKLVSKPDLVLTVHKRRIARGKNEVNVTTYRADPQETRDLLLARAARDIVYNIQHKKTEELAAIQDVKGGDKNKLMLLASVSNMDSWTKLRESLSQLPMVDRIEILAVSARQVDMVLHYRGDSPALARAINAKHIKLIQNKDYWVVSRE